MTKKTPQELFLRRWHKSNSVEKQIMVLQNIEKVGKMGLLLKI